MSSWKTTLGLLVALAVSLGWALRPIPAGNATAIQEAAAAVTKVPETSGQSERKRLAERKKPPRREHQLLRLQTAKSLEEQRLHDLALFRMLQENHRGFGWTSISRHGYPAEMSDLEILAKERERRIQAAHQEFLELEDYILDTEFTELTEEEQDNVYRYYEWRKQVDEAFLNYFDTPGETWLELTQWDGGLQDRCQELLKRQYQHDAEGMSLKDALQGFFPRRGRGSLSTSWFGGLIEIEGSRPTSNGIGLDEWWLK